MLFRELKDFDVNDLLYRILRGGLPPFFLEKTLPETDFQEWLSSYWAKDVQELFRVETTFFHKVYRTCHGTKWEYV